MFPINIQKVHPDAVIPEWATPGSAGFDLALPEDLTIEAGETKLVKLGLIIQAPINHFLLLVPRSSTRMKWGVSLANTVGIIDEDYCGPEDELKLLLEADPAPLPTMGRIPWTIPAGTRIAQGLFIPVTKGVFVESYKEIASTRGGLGSTGV